MRLVDARNGRQPLLFALALVVAGLPLQSLIGCFGPCDKDGNFCEDNRVVRCVDGETEVVSDCELFEMNCVETMLLESGRAKTTCALSDVPCAGEDGTTCVGDRIGTCGITEYPVCAHPYLATEIGSITDCVNCLESGMVCEQDETGASCVSE